MKGSASEPQLKFPKPVKKEKKKKYSSIKRKNFKNLSLDDALDDAFRLLVKCEAGWRCTYTGCMSGQFNAHPDIATSKSILDGDYDFLDCSHFFGRSDQGTRCSLENADSFCRTHHTLLEKLKGEGRKYYELKKDQLGAEKFEVLRLRSLSIVKIRDFQKKEIILQFLDRIQDLGYDSYKLKFKYKEALNG